jgi:hypothetical protein
MKEYLLLLRGGRPASEKTEAENKAEMAAWGPYMDNLAQNGQLVGGLPVVGGGKTVSAGSITNEAVTSAAEGIVGGYLIVKAANLDAAADIAKACPHIANNGNIEVREIAPMPTM